MKCSAVAFPSTKVVAVDHGWGSGFRTPFRIPTVQPETRGAHTAQTARLNTSFSFILYFPCTTSTTPAPSFSCLSDPWSYQQACPPPPPSPLRCVPSFLVAKTVLNQYSLPSRRLASNCMTLYATDYYPYVGAFCVHYCAKNKPRGSKVESEKLTLNTTVYGPPFRHCMHALLGKLPGLRLVYCLQYYGK